MAVFPRPRTLNIRVRDGVLETELVSGEPTIDVLASLGCATPFVWIFSTMVMVTVLGIPIDLDLIPPMVAVVVAPLWQLGTFGWLGWMAWKSRLQKQRLVVREGSGTVRAGSGSVTVRNDLVIPAGVHLDDELDQLETMAEAIRAGEPVAFDEMEPHGLACQRTHAGLQVEVEGEGGTAGDLVGRFMKGLMISFLPAMPLALVLLPLGGPAALGVPMFLFASLFAILTAPRRTTLQLTSSTLTIDDTTRPIDSIERVEVRGHTLYVDNYAVPGYRASVGDLCWLRDTIQDAVDHARDVGVTEQEQAPEALRALLASHREG